MSCNGESGLNCSPSAKPCPPSAGHASKVVVIGTKHRHVLECIVDVVDNRCCDYFFPTVGDDCNVRILQAISIQVAINADECLAVMRALNTPPVMS